MDVGACVVQGWNGKKLVFWKKFYVLDFLGI